LPALARATVDTRGKDVFELQYGSRMGGSGKANEAADLPSPLPPPSSIPRHAAMSFVLDVFGLIKNEGPRVSERGKRGAVLQIQCARISHF
jgi:hypothetical protein